MGLRSCLVVRCIQSQPLPSPLADTSVDPDYELTTESHLRFISSSESYMEFPRGQDLPDYDLSEVPLKPIFNATTTRYDLRDRYKRRRWHFRQYTSQFWLWELSSCTLSLVLVGIMIFQLKRIDGKPTVEWDWPWEPSSVLAFSVTVMKAAIMIAVASSLGQLKWHWFKETHQLDYMEHFDEASRGALGSAHLLMRLKLWSVCEIDR